MIAFVAAEVDLGGNGKVFELARLAAGDGEFTDR